MADGIIKVKKSGNDLGIRDQKEFDKFLSGIESEVVKVAQGKLIFALDATASRQPTWDMACELQAQMFAEVANVGSLQIQLVFYRGDECRASNWMANPAQLTKAMRSLACQGGLTQIRKVVSHVKRENAKERVAAVVFVGDAFEKDDSIDEIIGTVRCMGVPFFMFQEGSDLNATTAFKQIAGAAVKGAYMRFDSGAAKQLGEILKAVALYAVGGVAALEDRKDAGSVRLLGQLK